MGEMSGEVMRKNAMTETCDECCKPVCWFSYCCPVPRWALTLHATDAMNYWVALAVSFVGLFPCLMCFAMAFRDDLNQKLGGTKDACCKACLCAFFCSCCVNVKYAVALDLQQTRRSGVAALFTVHARLPLLSVKISSWANREHESRCYCSLFPWSGKWQLPMSRFNLGCAKPVSQDTGGAEDVVTSPSWPDSYKKPSFWASLWSTTTVKN